MAVLIVWCALVVMPFVYRKIRDFDLLKIKKKRGRKKGTLLNKKKKNDK